MWGDFRLILALLFCTEDFGLMKPSSSRSVKCIIEALLCLSPPFFSVSSPPSLHCTLLSASPLSLFIPVPMLFLPLLAGCQMIKQRLGGAGAACKRIRGVSCGCALSHASLVAHRDYQRIWGWLVVLCQFEGDLLFPTTSMHTLLKCPLTLFYQINVRLQTVAAETDESLSTFKI